MKKKIDLFWYWFIFVVAFVLCFFVVNDKNVSAYSLDSNGNIVSDNLYNSSLLNNCTYEFNSDCSLINNKLVIDIDYVGNYSQNFGYALFTSNIIDLISINNTFTFTLFIEDNVQVDSFALFYSNGAFYDSSRVYRNNSLTYTFTDNNVHDALYLGVYVGVSGDYCCYQTSSLTINGIMITKGYTAPIEYEPYGVWYSEQNAMEKFEGQLPDFTSSLIYSNSDNGNTYTINDVNSYIDNSNGYLYFNRLWNYLDNITSSSYDNAKLTIDFKYNLNINTTYIFNTSKQNYGSGISFYQDNTLMLDLKNIYDKSSFCGNAPQYSCYVKLNDFVNVGNGINAFSYLNKIEVFSATTDERTLTFGYENLAYNSGYDNGYYIGVKDGRELGIDLGFDSGYNVGYNDGYNKGTLAVDGGENTLVGLVGSIMTSPVNMLKTIFDFEFLGINLAQFLFSLISLFIIIWLIKLFL